MDMTSSLTEIDCGEVLTIAQSATLHSQLADIREQDSAVSMNISQLKQVDTAGVQLLYGFQRDAAAKGMNLLWSEPPPVLRDAASILGMPAFYE